MKKFIAQTIKSTGEVEMIEVYANGMIAAWDAAECEISSGSKVTVVIERG